jgi:hypothetical protein
MEKLLGAIHPASQALQLFDLKLIFSALPLPPSLEVCSLSESRHRSDPGDVAMLGLTALRSGNCLGHSIRDTQTSMSHRSAAVDTTP